jgi:NAD(P)-dependent dehydrogenase (short-subunit alcohol dehydrogenase family)
MPPRWDWQREGCKVAINGRDEAKIKSKAEKLQNETGSQVIGLAGDVSLPDVPEKLVQQAAETLGGWIFSSPTRADRSPAESSR